MARARQRGFDCLRPQVPGQSGFAGAAPCAKSTQWRRPDHLLWRWAQRLYRLSVARAGPGRATESLRGRPLALARACEERPPAEPTIEGQTIRWRVLLP